MTRSKIRGKGKRGRTLLLTMGILVGAISLVLPPLWQSKAQTSFQLAGKAFPSRTTASERARFLTITKATATKIRVGHGRRKIWVYFNPDCSYCHRLWISLDGVPDLTVYWIPVAFSLKTESLARSTAILSSKDPVMAFEENEHKFDDLREQGGYPIPPTLPVRVKEEVTKNTMMLRLWSGTIMTPTLLYKDKRGETQMSLGLPADIPAMIQSLNVGP